MPEIDEVALRQIFLDARTHNKWQPKDVPNDLLHLQPNPVVAEFADFSRNSVNEFFLADFRWDLQIEPLTKWNDIAIGGKPLRRP